MAVRLHATPRDHQLQAQLGDVLARNLAAANLMGRLHVVGLALKKTKRPVRLAVRSRSIKFFSEADHQGDTFMRNFSFDLPPTGAVDYLRNLTPVTREVFDGLTRQYANDAFTIAGVSDQRLIAKIREALAEIMAKGGTKEEFRAAVDALTTEAGVQTIAAFELETVFQTNVGKAYSAGRLEQMQEPSVLDAMPYWQYWTAGDLRVRPAHASLDGFCARAIDPVWRKIYPPNDYNCRCSVVPLLGSEAPEGSDHGGFERLPILARLGVPRPGFHTLTSN